MEQVVNENSNEKYIMQVKNHASHELQLWTNKSSQVKLLGRTYKYEIEIGIVHSMHTDKNDGLKCSESDREHPPYFIVWAGDVAKSAKWYLLYMDHLEDGKETISAKRTWPVFSEKVKISVDVSEKVQSSEKVKSSSAPAPGRWFIVLSSAAPSEKVKSSSAPAAANP